jgi:hypothetical protein
MGGFWRRPPRLRCRKARAIVNKRLSHIRNNTGMRFAMAAIFAVLIFNFADEHFNSARYTLAAMNVISNITRSFS